jgi:hypothetical protein
VARRNGERTERTWSIWGFVVLFVVLAVAGILLLLLVSPPGSETVALPVDPTSTTAPPASDGAAGSVDPDPDPGDGRTEPPVSFPDGTPAPDGAQQILVDGDITTISFATPERLATVPVLAIVPPVTVTPVPGADGTPGGALRLTVLCASTDTDVLAQVVVTEDATSVTVLPVVLAPVGGGPCGAAALRELVIPLRRPVGERSVRSIPPGTAVPTPTAGG